MHPDKQRLLDQLGSLPLAASVTAMLMEIQRGASALAALKAATDPSSDLHKMLDDADRALLAFTHNNLQPIVDHTMEHGAKPTRDA